MASSRNPFGPLLRELTTLMLTVAGESVTLTKRSAPEQSLTLKPRDEWKIYLEFLKILFNLADRMSALHLPVREQPQFMDSLEDATVDQLKTVMAPALGPDSDPMEIVVTIGTAVSESRNLYDRFHFVVTEDHQEKEAFFGLLAERIAESMGTTGGGMVNSAAILCTTAVIPAMNSLFESMTGGIAQTPTAGVGGNPKTVSAARTGPRDIGNEIKLLSVMSSIHGEEVETRWGLHPQFQMDLTPEETREMTKLMNRLTHILGERYASVAFSETWASWHLPGHA